MISVATNHASMRPRVRRGNDQPVRCFCRGTTTTGFNEAPLLRGERQPDRRYAHGTPTIHASFNEAPLLRGERQPCITASSRNGPMGFASIRPRCICGERRTAALCRIWCFGHAVASMRPRCYAGKDRAGLAGHLACTSSFNEAPLLRGERRKHAPYLSVYRLLMCDASMRPRCYAGKDSAGHILRRGPV